MGFFKYFILKFFLVSTVAFSSNTHDQVTHYSWVQDSNHQWVLKAQFEKADLDTYYDKGPPSEGLGISPDNRPIKQVFVYYPAGRAYSGQTYVSYDCQFEQYAWGTDGSSHSRNGKKWRFFYKDMSIPKIYGEYGAAVTFIEESSWFKQYSGEEKEFWDSDFYICYALIDKEPDDSLWGRFKYNISKFFKFSETDYEIALKKEREEFEKKDISSKLGPPTKRGISKETLEKLGPEVFLESQKVQPKREISKEMLAKLGPPIKLGREKA